jgi:glycosyltransferase involved in cell wall biosynthesis
VRIAIVSDAIHPWHTGGKETRYHELEQGLRGRGHDVHVHTMHWWQDTVADGNPASGGRRTRQRRALRTYRRADGAVLHAITPKIEMYTNGRRSITQGVLFAVGCLRMLGAKMDVIEADHMPGPQLYPLWLVARLRRKPLVVTWHEYWGRETWTQYLGRAGRIAALIERVGARLPDRIVAVSEGTAAALRADGVDPDRILVAPNGVRATPSIESRPRHGAIAVGRLIEHKRFDLAIETVRRLNDEGEPTALTIIGEGPERHHLETLAAASGIAEQITFLGTLPTQEELWARIAAAEVLIAGSEREGFGLALAEALTLGTPAVVSDHPDNMSKALVHDGVTGAIAHAGDPESFTAAYRRCRDLRPEEVRDRFTAEHPGLGWDRVVETHLEAYRAALAERRPRNPRAVRGTKR